MGIASCRDKGDGTVVASDMESPDACQSVGDGARLYRDLGYVSSFLSRVEGMHRDRLNLPQATTRLSALKVRFTGRDGVDGAKRDSFQLFC